jgi:ketopantoate reductase
MARRRRIEIDYLNGFVVREGKQVGIAARANKWLLISSKISSAASSMKTRATSPISAELRTGLP